MIPPRHSIHAPLCPARRQQDIFDKLAKKLQPFLEQVGTVVGKLLSIEGMPGFQEGPGL